MSYGIEDNACYIRSFLTMPQYMIREFGEFRSDVSYVLRQGGYAVIPRADGMVAVIAAPQGHFLPGGGQENGESPAEAAVREAYEECGLRIELIDVLGTVDQLVYDTDEEVYYRKRCTFFLARLVQQDNVGEADHRLEWLSAEVATKMLSHESQNWAVTRFLQLGRLPVESNG